MPDASVITTQYDNNDNGDSVQTLCGGHKAHGKSAR